MVQKTQLAIVFLSLLLITYQQNVQVKNIDPYNPLAPRKIEGVKSEFLAKLTELMDKIECLKTRDGELIKYRLQDIIISTHRMLQEYYEASIEKRKFIQILLRESVVYLVSAIIDIRDYMNSNADCKLPKSDKVLATWLVEEVEHGILSISKNIRLDIDNRQTVNPYGKNDPTKKTFHLNTDNSISGSFKIVLDKFHISLDKMLTGSKFVKYVDNENNIDQLSEI